MGDATGPESSSSLLSAVRVVRERIVVIIAAVVLVTIVAAALSLTATKEYTASTDLIIQPPQATTVVNQSAGSQDDPARDQATALLLLRSDAVAARVAKRLGGGVTASDMQSAIDPSSEPDANIITIAATDPDPAQAARIANGFAAEYASYSLQQARTQLDQSANDLRRQLQATPTTDTVNRQAIGATLTQVLNLRAVTTGNAQVVGQAAVPSTPSAPQPKRQIAIGIVLGLIVGLAIAFLIDLFDRRTKSLEDFEELYGLSALAGIPERHGATVTNRDREAGLEPFRILHGNLGLLRSDRDVRVVMVTSAIAGEGKSTVAVNLATTIARSGRTVALVECDMRRPTFGNHFRLDGADRRGLTSALVGGVRVRELLREISPDVRTPLSVLPCGPLPPNSTELLRSPRFTEVLDELTDAVDVVVLDCPPLLPVADAQVLLDNNRIDGCLVVGRAFLTKRNECRRARAILDLHRMRSAGLVINGLRESDRAYEYYGSADDGVAPKLASAR